jgi:hypothetical protein
MTTDDSFEGEPKAFKRAILSESLQRICGTCRSKAALRAQDGRNDPLVEFDQQDKRRDQYALDKAYFLNFFNMVMVAAQFVPKVY